MNRSDKLLAGALVALSLVSWLIFHSLPSPVQIDQLTRDLQRDTERIQKLAAREAGFLGFPDDDLDNAEIRSKLDEYQRHRQRHFHSAPLTPEGKFTLTGAQEIAGYSCLVAVGCLVLVEDQPESLESYLQRTGQLEDYRKRTGQEILQKQLKRPPEGKR